MAQKNTIIGNIASIRVNENGKWNLYDSVTGMNGGTKIFLSIADRYWNKKDEALATRFIPFQAFVPEGMTIQKGQLVCADFIINPYTDKDGYTSIAFDIIRWDFSLSAGNGGCINPDNGIRVAGGQFNDNNAEDEGADDGFRNISDEIDEELPFN